MNAAQNEQQAQNKTFGDKLKMFAVAFANRYPDPKMDDELYVTLYPQNFVVNDE